MMLRGTVMTDVPEGVKSPLNKTKDDPPLTINRGVELLLRNRRRRPTKPKTFQVQFSFFKWEINLSLDIKKKSSLEEA